MAKYIITGLNKGTYNDTNPITATNLLPLGGGNVSGDYLPLSGGTLSGNITAPSFIKSGGTNDDVLLGDGTTTSLSGLGGGGGYTSSNGILLTGSNFTPVYGTATNTIAQGNDSRINNGQTAFGWGDHALAGYSTTDTNTTYSPGTGLSLSGTTFNNTAPDQTVTLTGGGATSITGTYPNFTISSTDTNTDTNTTYTGGSGITLTGTVFSPTYGTGVNTIAQGNDSRINNGQTAYSWGNHAGLYEPTLGNPTVDGYVLSSTIAGTRSWVAMGGGGTTYTSSNGILLTGSNFAPTYGTTLNTIAQGNDSRINNGQTAFGWGNHATAGYSTTDTNTTYTSSNGILLTGTNFTPTYGTTIDTIAEGNHTHPYLPLSGGTVTGNITLGSGGELRVGANRYAFQYTGNGYGLYFSSSYQFQFRNSSGGVIAYTHANSGALWTASTVTALGGTSTDWNTAYSWGNHAGLYEPTLGNPTVDGYVLSSTIAGARSWVAMSGGGGSYTSSNGILLTGSNFTPTYGTTLDTIAQGNDSRINNGQTAFTWGNHATAGYSTTDTNTTYTGGSGITLTGTVFSATYGTAAGTVAQGNDSRILNGQTAFGWGNHSGTYLSLTGGTIDNGTNTTLTVLSDDTGVSLLELYGASQGTGRVYVGQSGTHGGGIEYNGDNSPATTGAGSDYFTLFRRNASTDTWTARNLYSSDTWEFRGDIYANTSSKVATEAWVIAQGYGAGGTSYSAGTGITLTSTTFSVVGGTGITADAGGVSITSGGVGATQLNVTGNGTTSQYLRSDGDGSFSWVTPPDTNTDTNTTYSAGTDITLAGTTFNVTSSESSTGSTIVKRNSSGDIQARLFRSEYDTTNASFGYIMTQNDTASDNYLRPTTPAQFRAHVTDASYPSTTGVGASGTWSINITGNAGWADQVDVNASNTGTGEYQIMWNSGDTVYSTSGITINRDAKRITATTFSGSLTGNASTATAATRSDLIDINNYTSTTLMKLLGSHQTGTSSNVYSTPGIYMNCSTSAITASGGFSESSLRKFKTNILPFKLSGLELVDKLDIVTFDRNDSEVKNKIGIIADDSPKEFLTGEEDAVDLYKSIFIQAKAIQELNAKVDTQQKQIDELKEMMAKILDK